LNTSSFVKPGIVISRCLGFAPCRYDGMIISDEFIKRLGKEVEFITVCPEVMIGLGVPRDPIRVISTPKGKVLFQPSTGRNLTDGMNAFMASLFNSLRGIDGFILKGKSPSCGIRNVKYFSEYGEITGRGTGFFGDAVQTRFSQLAIVDESHLEINIVREHFLSRIFAFARLREAVLTGEINVIIRFHNQNKLFLTAYNWKVIPELDLLLANRKDKPGEQVISAYEQKFRSSLSKIPAPAANIKAIKHSLKYFPGLLSEEENKSLADSLTRYKKGTLPLSSLIRCMRTLIDLYQVRHLLDQTYFFQYPEENE
jgi:uncharacterized protein YbbK (DUF523 family)/uncharacterized protein YbgA (DUF1722 family)